MTLLEVAARLDEFNEDAVIFAEVIDGAFVASSEASVMTMSEAEREENVNDVAARRCPGLQYCLEVWIAKDSVRVWSQWRGGQMPSAAEAAEAICYKATFDGWGPPNF
jgi:hypothetical protein